MASLPRLDQATAVITAGLLVSGLGIALIAVLFISGGWPTYGPFLLPLWGLPFLASGIWARRRNARPMAPWAARNVALWSLPLMAAGFAAWFGSTGVTSVATHSMTWSYGEPPVDSAGERHIVLRFTDYPNHAVGFYSSQLAMYLESLPTPDVEAEFELTRDFGRLRGFAVVSVGSLAAWRSGFSYNAVSGDYDPSPWQVRARAR